MPAKPHWPSLLLITLCLAATTRAQADETLPARQSGLWLTTMKMRMILHGKPVETGEVPTISALCIDGATDAGTFEHMLAGAPGCTDSIARSGNVYTLHATCPDPMGGGGQMTTEATITRISDHEIDLKSSSKAPSLTAEEEAVAKWQGACPAGWQPGDFGEMVDGKLVKRAPPTPAP